MSGDRRRRALTIGVSAFSDGNDLPFTSGLVAELASALEAVGYSCTAHPVRELPSAELGGFVARELESAEPDHVQVVHVLTHGESGDGDATVYALGSDGTRHPSGDIAHWLNTVQNSANGPLTLFLLDLCHSGSLARQAWQTKLADSRTRAWVIAATEGDKSAYDGRFTQAVINVLRAAANGELDIDPTKEHIPLQVVAPAIRREVNRLTAEVDGYQQDVTASVVDISAEVDPPFFPNPRYAPGDRDLELRASLDPGLVPFLDDLDEGLDARHFIERGSGFDGMIGCFAGREAQLKQLSPWLNRHAPGNLGVVTGSPGVGKSALLGVLVCAAHPVLRDRTRKVWVRAAQAPYPIDDGFAAIHARQRNLAAISTSLAAQLELDADSLIENIRALPVRPVIVIDALDEADNSVEVMTELLLPLSAVARVLVGTRRYEQYAPLLAAADFVVDLDDVAPDVLQEDLYRYVSDLLGATRYRGRGAIRGAFATEVAKALATPSETPWGEFLVAGLYTRYFITAHAESTMHATLAEDLGGAVPRTLPEVLDLDLAAHSDHPWLRPVLAVLARANGQGMPVSVLARTAYSQTNPPSYADLRTTLKIARFYLRQATDTDHTTLYRLFHQGLADHLRASESESEPARLLDRLLDPLGPAGSRDWSAAEPYVLRHALQHARDADRLPELLLDPGFLLAMDPDDVEAAAAELGTLRGIAEVQRLTMAGSEDPEDRRAALALNAARAGMTELAERAANPPGQKPLIWQPLWAEGRPEVKARRPEPAPVYRASYGVPGLASRVACGTVDGRPIAAVVVNGELHFASLDGHPQPSLHTPEGVILDVALSPTGDGHAVAITGGPLRQQVITWNLSHEATTVLVNNRNVHAIACGIRNGSPIVAIAIGRELRLFDLTEGVYSGFWLHGHDEPVTAVACTSVNGRPVVVSADTATLRVWDVLERKQLGAPLTGHQARVTAIACTAIPGPPVAISIDNAATLRIWDLQTLQPIDDPIDLAAAGAPKWADAYIRSDGKVVAVVPDSASVSLWDLHTRQMAESFSYPNGPPAGTFTSLDGAPTLVVATSDGTLEVRNLGTGHAPAPVQATFAVNRCGIINSAPPFVVVADVDGWVVSRDLATGSMRSPWIPGRGEPLAEIRAVELAGHSMVALIEENGTSRVWSPTTGQVNNAWGLFPARPQTNTKPMVAVPFGQHLWFAEGREDGRVSVLDYATMKAEHNAPVTALAAMKFEGRILIFSGGADSTVQVCDLTANERLAVIGNLLGPVDQLEVTTGGYLVIVAGGELVCGRLRL